MDPSDHCEVLADGLVLRATASANSPVLERFLAGYDRAFVLPQEREEADGFRACLALNDRQRQAFGRRYRELVVTLENGSGVLLGGANFLATAMSLAGMPPLSIALNYLFVERQARRRGLTRVLVDCAEQVAQAAVLDRAGAGPAAVFIEQNDPLRLTADEYAADSHHAGIDQIDRIAIWARLGARLVDFPYVQPALSTQHETGDDLFYAALRFPGETIPAAFLHDHLESFFGVSVLKGGPLDEDPVASSQLGLLATRQAPVALLDVGPALAELRRQGLNAAGQSFRDHVRRCQRDRGR